MREEPGEAGREDSRRKETMVKQKYLDKAEVLIEALPIFSVLTGRLWW